MTHSARHLRGLAFVLACFALSACDEKLSSITGPTPNLEPTFTSFLTEITQADSNQARA